MPTNDQKQSLQKLLTDIRACTVCSERLPLGPRPVLQVGENAPILIAGQAPGTKVHKTGVPFNDPSGDRLRDWMGIDRQTFYDAAKINIVPMGFCYPGRLEKGGDKPPEPVCSKTWHPKLFAEIPKPKLTLVIGAYAQAYHLGVKPGEKLTDIVRSWRDYGEGLMPLPHPSPRNIFWLRRNPWFEEEVVPEIRKRVKSLIG